MSADLGPNVRLRVSDEVKDRWIAEAERRGLSLSALIVLAVETLIAKDATGDELLVEIGREVIDLVHDKVPAPPTTGARRRR